MSTRIARELAAAIGVLTTRFIGWEIVIVRHMPDGIRWHVHPPSSRIFTDGSAGAFLEAIAHLTTMPMIPQRPLLIPINGGLDSGPGRISVGGSR